MDEKLKKVLARQDETFAHAAKQVVPTTLGKAVLDLLANGNDCDRAGLLKWLEEAIAATPKPGLQRQIYEAAQKALLAARTSAP